MQKGRKGIQKKNLFIIADAGVNTGFATVSHNLIDHLHTRWNIDVLAINYQGDPHDIQKKARLWNPAGTMYGDLYGLSRVSVLSNNLKSDVILMINDPWIAAEYTSQLKKSIGKKVLYTPVDAKNIKSMYVDEINKSFDHVITYTQFGADQLLESGLKLPYSVIPHGVDRQNFFPVDQTFAREKSGIDNKYFIVQVVDRNQVRKRIDLAIYYFAEWVKRTNKPDNVMFYYHGAMKDEGWDIGQLMVYNDIKDRLILSHHNLDPAHGFPIDFMKIVYSLADIKVSTTLGEGWGLTTMESMACGVANIAPNYAALGEWAKDGIYHTDISHIPSFNIKGINTIGGVADMESTIAALELLYQNKEERNRIAKKGLALISQPKFQWSNIAKEFENVFNTVETVELEDD